MLKRVQYWMLSAVGAGCLALAALNMMLVLGNHTLQNEVSARSQYIQQSGALQGLYQGIVRAVADLSVRNKDDRLSAVLARQGIKVTASATPPAGAAAAAPQTQPIAPQRAKGSRHE